MAWPQPPPPRTGPAPASPPAELPRVSPRPGPAPAPASPTAPPRPASAGFFKNAESWPLSSPMLLSTGNAKKSTAERRESAPPVSRSSAFSPLSSPITGIEGGELPKQRPRSNSHIQISLYSQTAYERPLPAPPLSNTPTATSNDAIKVPVEDSDAQSCMLSPALLNSSLLHPNSYARHPQSPKLPPQDLPFPSNRHHASRGPGAAKTELHPLEYQPSIGSNVSDPRPMPALRAPLYHCDTTPLVPGGTSVKYNQDHYHAQGRGLEQGHGHNSQQANASVTANAFGESSSLHYQFGNFRRDDSTTMSKQLPSALSMSSSSSSYTAATSSLTEVQQQHTSPRLANRNTSSSSSSSSTSPSTTMAYTSAAVSSYSSPSLSFQEHLAQYQPNLADLQPYYPPPPPSLSSVSPAHPRQHAYSIGSESTASSSAIAAPVFTRAPTNNMATNKSTKLDPNYGNRRHSSGARELSVKTQQLTPIKKGPSTADATVAGGRHLDTDGTVRGSAQTRSRSRQPSPSPTSHLPRRQTPNHLAIPQSSHFPSRQASQQNPLHPQQPLQNQQNQSLLQQTSSTARSSNSPRPTSPCNSGLLDTVQDRTAMALMQSYLIHPDDPDSEADIAMQIMISQAAVDSKGFEVLQPHTVESIKRHHASLSSRIAALTARLSLESKIREAAQSLLKLHADNKKLARQASDHLEAANRKVDQVATELWKLTQLAADLQRTLLQHTSGVLALGVVRLEDQGRRERDMHAIQIWDARVGQDVEDQFETMAKVIMSLESGALEAQSLLEDKDRAIERLMKQLEHQRDLFAKLDEQQQKTMALSQSQLRNLDTFHGNKDSKTVAEMTFFLGLVQQQLQRILQQEQQRQPERHRKQTSANQSTGGAATDGNNEATTSDRRRAAQAWSSETTLISKLPSHERRDKPSSRPLREDYLPSEASDGNMTTGTFASEAVLNSNSWTPPGKSESSLQFSVEGIRSILDALESRSTESQQKMQILEGELGLLRRQSQVLSASRNNSIKIKNFSAPRGGQAEETIRAALEKSLKDALLAKEVAQLELENERQRWQEDQNHRISALEESLVAVEDMDKKALVAKEVGESAEGPLSRDGVVQELRKQLSEAIDEIDVLNNQQQSSLKSMRQLFDLIPDPRRKSHMQLYSSHQQLQQHIVASPGGAGSSQLSTSGSAGFAEDTLSSSTLSAVGFSMEALISRVKELVGRYQQVDQDNLELRKKIEARTAYSRQSSSQNLGTQPKARASSDNLQSLETSHQQPQQKQERSTWILNTDLERLQANAGMVQLLEKELDLLKQHTDMLLDENARLADLAAANTTNSPAPSRSSVFGGAVQRQTRDDALDELEEIIRVKDRLLRERDQLVQKQEKTIRQIESDMAKTKTIDDAGVGAASAAEMSSFDVTALEELRRKCGKLEEEAGEMRMIVAALESLSGGPGSGSQILRNLSIASNSQSPLSPWLGSSLGTVGSASHGSLSQTHSFETAFGATSPAASSADVLSPGGSSSVVVAGATAALRKEFRRAMGELRDEKEKAVRKEVEERRRLEREVRQLRRELQTTQISMHS